MLELPEPEHMMTKNIFLLSSLGAEMSDAKEGQTMNETPLDLDLERHDPGPHLDLLLRKLYS